MNSNFKNTNDRPPPASRMMVPGANPAWKEDKPPTKMIETKPLIPVKSILKFNPDDEK